MSIANKKQSGEKVIYETDIVQRSMALCSKVRSIVIIVLIFSFPILYGICSVLESTGYLNFRMEMGMFLSCVFFGWFIALPILWLTLPHEKLIITNQRVIIRKHLNKLKDESIYYELMTDIYPVKKKAIVPFFVLVIQESHFVLRINYKKSNDKMCYKEIDLLKSEQNLPIVLKIIYQCMAEQAAMSQAVQLARSDLQRQSDSEQRFQS